MQLHISAALPFLLFLSSTLAKDCTAGSEESPCVWVGTGSFDDLDMSISYQPDCSGHCYVYPFNGIGLRNGEDGRATTCTTYSDNACQNVLNQTVKADGYVPYAGYVLNPMQPPQPIPGGNSMRCYYGCTHH